MRKARLAAYVAAPLMALGVVGGIVQASPAGAASTQVVADTALSNWSDSGVHGNWATDTIGQRNVVLTSHGLASVSHCPGITTGNCRYYTARVSDLHASFATIPGATSPGNGYLNSGNPPVMGAASVTGPMTGGASYKFYANVSIATAIPDNVPQSVDGSLPGAPHTGNWPELFWTGGAGTPGVQFWDTSGNTNGNEYLLTSGSWKYTAGPGKDAACPNVSSQWVDGSATSWGTLNSDGNILAPDGSVASPC
jgi:hypothetical protein